MKITRFLLIGLALFAVACSKDDEDTAPSLDKESVTLSLAEEDKVIEAPAGMATSNDVYAQMAVGYINSVNVISTYLTLFNQVPDGATKSNTKITASNGRVKAAGDVVTYVWEDPQSQFGIAYQLSETTDSYLFEFFYKLEEDGEYLKYFEAKEKKDRSSGYLKVFDIFMFEGEDPSLALVEYSWSRSGDILTFVMEDYSGFFHITITINEVTKAGSVEYIIEDVKQYEMEWDTLGNGSWTFYDDEGNVEEEGTWTID